MTTHTPAPAHLTDAEIQDIADGFDIYGAKPEFARAIESALLSKLRAPVADERISDETLWSWAEQIMGGKEAHHVGRDRVLRFARAALASAPVARNNMRNPNLSRQGGWIKTDGFCDFLILAGIIGAIVGGILIPEVISFLWDFAKPWIHEVTK